MSEVVKVIIRERPSTDPNGDVVIRHCNSVQNRIFVDDRPFTVGQVFDCNATQEDVYCSVKILVTKFLEGFSCNVLSYGQSGTGKSYTMGLQSDNFESANCGIVPRALSEIMEFAQNPQNDTTIEISFFEIYNEKVFDLLSDKTEPINSKGSKFTGGVKRTLSNFLDAELVLMEGNKNRRTRPTTMNKNSSRSHGIVVIYRKNKTSSSSFYIVDLAGSEGVRRTGHKGEALAEGSHINRGLLGIGNIFKALSDGSCRVPYRDTVLGSVLQDSLNLNGFSTLVICISALKQDVSETINSLSFAQKVMNMKNNPKIVPTLQTESKTKPTPKKEEQSSMCKENFETPIAARRPVASSTTLKHRPNLNKIVEMPTPIPLIKHSSRILDLQNSQLMNSPTVKQCFEAMKQTLQKRNIRINSINFSTVEETLTSDSDSYELNSTVIPNVHREAIENVIPNVHREANERKVPATESPKYMTKEECIQLVEAQLANLTQMKPESAVNNITEANHKDQENDYVSFVAPELDNIEIENAVPEADDSDHSNNNSSTEKTIAFEFKVPELPVNHTDRRRSVRIQQNAEKRKSIVPILPPPTSPPKRRRATISKKVEQVPSVSKEDHRSHILGLLNKGDMKAIQVLPLIGMKTAYSIITHRSLNGKFKSFKEVSKAPFWRGKGWERFEKANNLC